MNIIGVVGISLVTYSALRLFELFFGEPFTQKVVFSLKKEDYYNVKGKR